MACICRSSLCGCYTEQLVVRDTASNRVLLYIRQRLCSTACLDYIVGRQTMSGCRSV